MKKLFALLLTLTMLLCLAAPALAAEEDVVMLSRQSLTVDGKTVECEKYNINGNNFFKLRDLAALLNGTGSQFDVEWDAEKGLISITSQHAYDHPDYHELEQRGDLSAEAIRSPQTIEIDGAAHSELTAWNIGGSNFFMLRELGKAIGFVVDYEPVSNTAVVQSLPVLPHTLLVAVGETAFADLDGDGTDNAVRVWLEKDTEYGYWYVARLSIDGTEYTDELYALRGGDQFDAPDEYWWAITDLDTGDGRLEIAIQDWGPSDDLTTSFFRFDGKALSYLGAPEGFLFFQNGAATMTVNGNGTLRSELRLSVLQTWWTMVDYAVGSDGLLAPVPQEFYTSTFANQQITLKEALYAYDTPDGTRSVLPAGTAAQLVGTDNAEWIKLILTDGSDAWLHLIDGYQLAGPDGNVYSWEALDGLLMAD